MAVTPTFSVIHRLIAQSRGMGTGAASLLASQNLSGKRTPSVSPMTKNPPSGTTGAIPAS
eukprot:CAMPEP_0113301070 /NCGR_PEP_ID=MMETSP0010_2-20120614/2451_1 /TAXON_ID=216773 ORGANISM="Corethron hystrix, Strain 308" /NCGR_SAMPLE_ID=MMETSP0010_2 /ASSEMBLY_ACC=CAM_ASM_000155 /LENGTH=59 /DNA_ID=CAMNT_0000154629 /DNA_START=418 /DNA_END=594 /DNA_ORIENTATION=+ /assembly_acc=CAM_ASM_000155